MSIKLHNGLIVNKALDIDIFAITKLVRDAITPVFNKLAYAEACEILFRILDNPKIVSTQEGFKDQILLTAAEDYWNQLNPTKNRSRFDHDPYRFNIVFGKAGQSILAYPYLLKPAYLEALEEIEVGGVKLFLEYSYENQTDHIPKGVTKKQYKKRLKDWESLENAEGTFGSLPHWTLPNSLDIFGTLWMSDFDFAEINSLCDPRKRLIAIIQSFYYNSLFRGIPEEVRRVSELYKLIVNVSRITKEFLATRPIPERILPHALTADMLSTEVSKLPPYVVDEEFFAPLEKQLREMFKVEFG